MAVKTEKVNVGRYADLLIGIVPSINLEWIQKMHRDRSARGQTQEAIVETILRRMPDYINYICPQFSETQVNFQRVPIVDTSNPFTARHIPSQDESMLVIRFRDPRGVDFPYLLSMLKESFMSRGQHHRLPWRQDAARHAADLHPDDLAIDGTPASGGRVPRRPARGPDNCGKDWSQWGD